MNNKNYKTPKVTNKTIYILVTILFVIFPDYALSQLSGSTYTINNTQGASASNYTDFQSFFDDIYQGSRNDGGPSNGPGVSDSVRVSVEKGTVYNEQVTVYPEASMNNINRVTIIGNDALITFDGYPGARHTIWMAGADYYTFDGLRIEGVSSEYVQTVRLSDMADYNIFRNCEISAPNYDYRGVIYTPYPDWTYYNYSGWYAGAIVAFCVDPDELYVGEYYYAQNGRGNLFENNRLLGPTDGASLVGPSYGIYEQGGASKDDGENEFIRNEIRNISAVGIYSYGSSGGKYNFNTITHNLEAQIQEPSWDNWFYGIDIRHPYLQHHPSKDIEIIGNNISDIGDVNRNDGASSFAGINVMATDGCEGCWPAPIHNGTNIIRIERNIIANNAAGNYNNTYPQVYGISCWYANSTFVINNLVSNNTLADVGGWGGLQIYDIFKYVSSGDVINNTFYSNIELSNADYYSQMYMYPSNLSANQANPPLANTSRFENNIIYRNVKGASWTDDYNVFGEASSIRNNSFYFNHNYYMDIWSIGSSGNGNWAQNMDMNTINSLSNEAEGNISEDPEFVDPESMLFYPTNPKLNAGGYDYSNSAYLAGINIDLHGDSRNPKWPDIGALEVIFDYAISGEFNNGDYSLCGGETRTMKVEIQNLMPFDLSNPKVGFQLNNNVIVYQTANLLVANSTLEIQFDNLIDFTGAPENSVLKVFIAHADDNNSNDTLTFNLTVGRGPFGGIISLNPNTKGMAPEGDRAHWITITGDTIMFNITSPTNYANNQYGIEYDAVVSAKTIPGGINVPTGSNYTHNITTGGTWTFDPPEAFVDSMIEIVLKLRDFNTTCDSTITRTVFVAPFGKPNFKIPTNICVGNQIVLENEATVHSGYLEYEWDFGNGVTSKQTNGQPIYMTPGTYQVTLKTTTVPLGFVKSITKPVIINAGPIADFTYTSSCFGSPVVLTNTTTSTVGTPTYSWDFGNGQTTGTTNANVNYTTPGMYTVKLSATRNGCTSVKEESVAMFEQPSANFVLISGTCANSLFKFNNTTSNVTGQVGYKWSFGENNILSTQMQGEHLYTTSGNKNVKLVVTTPLGCRDSITKTISVLAGPSANFSVNGKCQNSDIVFTSTDVVPGGTSSTFSWNIDNQVSSGTNVTKQFASVGNRTATLEVQYNNGCSNTVSKEFETNPSPVANFTTTNICANQPEVLENNTIWTDGVINYVWDFGAGITSTEVHPIRSFPTVGNTTVKLTASVEGGCTDEITKSLTVNQSPNRCAFEISQEGDKGNRYFVFKPTDGNNTGSEAGVNYTWYFGDGNSSTDNQGEIDYNSDGTYNVRMIARTASGCECETTQQVVVDRMNAPQISGLVSFNVYPNPNTGIFKVEVTDPSAEGKIEVIDVVGNIVFSATTAEMESLLWTIDLSKFTSGIYLVRYTSGNQTGVKKLQVIK